MYVFFHTNNSIEAVLATDRGAAHSADLGTSSKESY